MLTQSFHKGCIIADCITSTIQLPQKTQKPGLVSGAPQSPGSSGYIGYMQCQTHYDHHLLISFISYRKGFAACATRSRGGRASASLYRTTHCRPWGSISMQQQAGTITGNPAWASPKTVLCMTTAKQEGFCDTCTHTDLLLLGYSHWSVQVRAKETHKPFTINHFSCSWHLSTPHAVGTINLRAILGCAPFARAWHADISRPETSSRVLRLVQRRLSSA